MYGIFLKGNNYRMILNLAKKINFCYIIPSFQRFCMLYEYKSQFSMTRIEIQGDPKEVCRYVVL